MKLKFSSRPRKYISDQTGSMFKEWREGDFKITHTAGWPYVSWSRFNVYDRIDNRQICGWQVIGENRTLRAAIRRCNKINLLQRTVKGM